MLQQKQGFLCNKEKKWWNYVMRCREQSQKSMSIDRSCLDSSVSLFRHSMKSLRPPWGPSSQMKAQSLGRRSSRCVRPAEKQTAHSESETSSVFQNHWVMIKTNLRFFVLTCEDLEAYLCERRQSRLVEHTDAANLLNFSRVHSLPSYWLQDVSHRSRLLKCSLEEVCQHTGEGKTFKKLRKGCFFFHLTPANIVFI